MELPELFHIGGAVAMLGWLGLLASLLVRGLRQASRAAARFIIPALLGVAYVVLIVEGWNKATGGGFGSIEQVRALFSVDAALTAGWFHYLAFDLFVGSWIAEDGLQNRVHPLLLVPCLALTFLFGPAGLLLFFGIRLVSIRRTA